MEENGSKKTNMKETETNTEEMKKLKLREYRNAYYDKNKEAIREKKNKWYHSNKQRIAKQSYCEVCDYRSSKSNMRKHEQTNRHIVRKMRLTEQ